MLADILGYTNGNPTQIGTLKVDIVETINYSYEQTMPMHPVELGYEINDTIINKPLRVDMRVGISSHPVTWFYKNGRGVEKFANGVQALLAIRDAKKPVTIIRYNDKLEDMIMTSCKYSYTKDKAGIMYVDLTFVKLVSVGQGTAEVPASSVSNSVGGSPVDGGTGNTTNIGGGTGSSTGSSIAASGVDMASSAGNAIGNAVGGIVNSAASAVGLGG